MRATASLIALLFASGCATGVDPRLDARGTIANAEPIQAADAYYVEAAAQVADRAEARGTRTAKNIILFIGDGMGVSTITAGRIYAGQKRGLDGESHRLAMETLPWAGLSKTYAHDAQVSDSAATATALVAGVKSRSRTLGVRSDAAYNNCPSIDGQGVDTIFELAERSGVATGVVTTTRLTHATPASVFAESPNRNWEDDTDVAGTGCKDIAAQLVDWPAGDGLEIALGGGRRHFLPNDVADPEYPDRTGARADGRNLVSEWEAKSPEHVVVHDLGGLRASDFDRGAKVLGLFEPSHMNYELDRAQDRAGEPSLEEMTRTAIARLSQNESGYVLMVEGGRIDHAHHGSNAARALEDVDALDQAVAAALELTSDDDTLIIVTADHSHTLVIQGYQARGTSILGKAAFGPGGIARAADGKPYTTLSYANGPGAVCADPENCTRPDVTDVDTEAKDYRQQALVPLASETHAGEDVAVFASGPGAELIGGVMEQNEIFHVMSRAAGFTR